MAKAWNERLIEKRKYWKNHVEVWKASGLSQAEYCRKNSLRLRGFGYWKIKFKKENLPELIEIQDAIPGVPGVLKLNIRHQFQIEIPDGFSCTTLGQILLTLKSL